MFGLVRMGAAAMTGRMTVGIWLGILRRRESGGVSPVGSEERSLAPGLIWEAEQRQKQRSAME